MNLEEKIVGDIAGEFKIESYQRGYRWGKEQIEYFLNDINEIPDGQSYCLQPIVVKDIGNIYELIDGQQRLTTLFLIMKYLSIYVDLNYSIEYTTRKSDGIHIGSQQLLENIDKIDLKSPSSNIDELFIKRSYQIISDWFNGEKAKMNSFAGKLQKYVTIIWYEVDPEEVSIDIFTRLNIGKISLTNAELVKALFLSKGRKDDSGGYVGNPYGIDNKTQHEIALQWDAMEKALHDKKFWAFITNEEENRYPVRMELFFDLMENKPANEYSFYTFNKFYNKFKEKADKSEVWETIVRYYQQLREWYKDFDLYHQIGYLVSSGHSLKELLDLAINPEAPLNKSEFRKKIIEKIRESVKFQQSKGEQTEEIDYIDLNYEDHPGYIHRLLLLFNVETIRQKGDENNRFPFQRYKNEGTWSLEHIHAQNSESLKTNHEWKDWLEFHKRSLLEILKSEDKNSDKYKDIEGTVAHIEKVLSNINNPAYRGSIRDEFTVVSANVVKLLSDKDDKTQMHSLPNMALLTVGENAALSNSTFDVKRMKIIEMDRQGVYIPVCTKNVFLKYYSSSDTKLHYWTEADKKDYIEAINKVLWSHPDKQGNMVKLIKERIRYGNY